MTKSFRKDNSCDLILFINHYSDVTSAQLFLQPSRFRKNFKQIHFIQQYDTFPANCPDRDFKQIITESFR